MKKNCSKKIKMMAVMMALAMIVQVFAPALTAKAAGAPGIASSIEGIWEPQNKDANFWIPIDNFPKNAKVTNLKSSNTKVLKAKWDKNDPEYIVLKFKKAGKATVSFNLVYGNKTKALKSKVTVRKYQRPCSVFKVGKKNYVSQFKGKSYHRITYKGDKKYKISVKAAKGWKLKEIYYYSDKTKNDKKIKNNATIKCSGKKGSYAGVYASFQNKKTKDWQTVSILFIRK